MNHNVLINDFFMEIRKNLPRFLSILLIVALGVAFFSGVRATKPDMQKTAEALYDENNLMDLRIVSALGLTASDLEAVKEVEGVEEAVGVYTADVLYEGEESKYVLRLMSNSGNINQMNVLEGRMPERESECFVDRDFANSHGIGLEDVVTVVSGTRADITESVNTTQFVVVGIGDSPAYIWRDRGTSAVGNGSVSGFLIVQPEVFVADAYSEIDLTVSGVRDLDSFKEKYEKEVDKTADRIEQIQEEHAKARYDQVSDKAEEELVKAETELADAQKQLDDSKARLDQAQGEIDEAKKLIEEKLQEILSGQTTVAQQEQALNESKAKLDAAKLTLDNTRIDIENKQAALNAGMEQLQGARAQLTQSWAQWTEQSNAVAAQRAQLTDSENQLNQKRAELENKRQQLQQMLESLGAFVIPAGGSSQLQFASGEAQSQSQEQEAEPDVPSQAPVDTETPPETEPPQETEMPPETEEPYVTEDPGEVPEEVRALQEEVASLETKVGRMDEELANSRANVEQAEAQLNNTWTELDNLGQQLEAQGNLFASTQADLNSAAAQLALGEADYAQQKATLDAGILALDTAKKAVEAGQTSVSGSQTEVAGAQAELDKGKAEYEKQYTESRQKMKEATEELNDKKRQLLKMDVPEWNVLDRSYIQSYEGLAQDADRVGAIGNVFPLIFFLVAALVSLTSITRMVEEQRMQIGTLKALGYEKSEIAAKYICYALLATVTGGILGLILGQTILPRVIIRAYRILYYALPATKAPLHFGYSVSSVLIASLCTSAAAFAACYRQLTTGPAQLMRPEAPKEGKRVFLEKWSWLWSRLNFSRKAAVRNMIRYKKRFFMTIFGIAASTALLLVGFGLKNSVNAIGERQFGKVQKYHGEILLDNNDVAPLTELEEVLKQDKDIKSYMYLYKAAMDVGKGDREETAYVTVPEETENFKKYINLKKRGSDTAYEIEEEGVLITEKLAKLLGVQTGDTIYLMDSENYRVEVKVNGITENYFRHYIYMSPAQYEKLYGGAPSYNEILTINAKDTEAFENEMGEKYLELDAVSTIIFNSSMQRSINDMLKNMNLIIVVLIVSAALLAFVVLYNLNHINITERRRELASIKVLGFYDGELTMYVLRENLVLTVIGIVIGLILGVFLHRFVILTAELDKVMFGRSIRFTSFLFSIVLTAAFAACVNWIMHFSLKKIDMVESMKSVE